jgi:hypothetical protein
MTRKIIIKSILLLLLTVILIGIVKFSTLQRLYRTIHLFDEEVIAENFRNMDKIFPVSRLEPSPKPFAFPRGKTYELPESFDFKGEKVNTQEFIQFNRMEGLLILHQDSIVFEEYWDLDTTETYISWSVAKSIVSLLLGMAYDDGLFQLDEPITKYLPQFEGTGYDGVKIKDILQMSSGVKFNENYAAFNSDINRFGRAFALGNSLEDFAKSLVNEKEPGTYNRYVSIDTQVLGMLLKKVTGESLTEYFQERLWNPLGMQDEAEWIIDNTGMEVALGGLNMSLRDYAKVGQLALHKGNWKGTQLVSEEWIDLSTTPDAPHLRPGKQEHSNNIQGYGFQWWITEIDEGDFYAVGIHDQYVYVQPKADVVIACLSANHHFYERDLWGPRKHIYLFKSIAKELKTRAFPNPDVTQSNP